MNGYPSHVWEQLKNITADELVRALLKDGFISEGRRGGTLGYYNPTSRKRVTIHLQKVFRRRENLNPLARVDDHGTGWREARGVMYRL